MKTIKYISLFTFLLLSQYTFAQVRGISYTLAPAGEYVWWNDKAGLEDNFLVGGKLGLGFGEFFELRGSYMQSLNMMTNFDDFGITNFDPNTFTAREAKVTRYGGEMRANFSRGRLLPFILLGTGIQKIQLESFAERQQIYLNAGLGITLGIADRFTLTLEGRNTAYRYNSGANLLTGQDQINYGVAGSSFGVEDLTNWSAGASLQFYLGGRKPGQQSDLDKAYFDSFSKGGGGFNLGLEAVAGKMVFNNNLLFRDTWMAGGSAGFDIGPYVGLRGFYWRAMEEGSMTSFDDLAMWGGEMRMKLNTAGGMVPYIMLGGGKMDVNDGYRGRMLMSTDTIGMALSDANDAGFAMGGAGLLIPLGRNLKIFGSARAVLTSSAPINDLSAPEEIFNSWFYSAGVKLNLGKRSQRPEDIVQQQISDALIAQEVQNDTKAAAIQQKYEKKVLDLENQLIDAYAAQDLAKAEIIKEKKKEAEQVVVELENRDQPTMDWSTDNTAPAEIRIEKEMQMGVGGVDIVSDASQSEIRMSPREFEDLIEKIMASGNNNYNQIPVMLPSGYAPNMQPMSAMPNDASMQQVMQRLESIEKKIVVEAPIIDQENGTPMVTEEMTNEKEMLSIMIDLEQKLKENNEALLKVSERLERLEQSQSNAIDNTTEPVQIFKKKKKRKKNKEENK